jgi:hypothetical protein
MRMHWTLALAVAAVAGLMLQANLGANDKKVNEPKKKKVEAGKDLIVNGELTDKDDKDKVRTQSYCKTYTYKMVKGRTYQIDMKSKNLDSYLRLENPKGDEVAKDDDSGDFLDARIIYKAEETGNFKIYATTFDGGVTGKFTLTVKDKDAPAATGKAIELKNEKGKATYTGNLDKDDPLYKNKKHKLFTFAMEAGKTYQIDMKSGALDSYLFLESPDGDLLDQDDDGGGFPDARIVHKAAKAGSYRIICTHFGGGGFGEFTLTVRQIDKE